MTEVERDSSIAVIPDTSDRKRNEHLQGASCDLRDFAIPELLAHLSRLAQRHGEIFQRLGDAIHQVQISHCRIIEVGTRDGIPVKELAAALERNDTVLFSLDVGLAVKNGGSPHALPPGYPLFDISGFHENSKLVSTTGAARFLEIPRAEFHALYECDLGFKTALKELIHKAHPAAPMPEDSREQIRHTRGQNINALVTREGISAVNGRDGIQEILNPKECCVESPFETEFTSRIIDPIQQRWALIRGVSTLAAHLNRQKLTDLARKARAWADELPISEEGRAGIAVHAFQEMLRQQERSLIQEQLPALLRTVEQLPFEVQDREKLFSRMLEIAWLGDGVKKSRPDAPLEKWDRALSAILTSSFKRCAGSLPGILKDLDRRVETLMDARTNRQEEGILSIAVQEIRAELYLVPPRGKEVPRTDSNYRFLADLQDRLQKGEVSAVGGADYAAKRFPDDALGMVCTGKVPVVLYNGRHEDALAYAHWRYGPRQVNPYVVENSLAMNLQGAYGSFSRSWVFFRDGSSVLLVSHLGKSRQLSNAGALLLYNNGENQRVPLEQLVLVDGVQDIAAEVKSSVGEALKKSEEAINGKTVLGQEITDARNLPTQALILQHPRQLEATLKGAIEIHSYETKSLGKLHIGYIKNSDGGITRLLIVTVGGSGLYGDTAGYFVDAIFDRELIPNLIPHVLKNATAGGTAGTANRSDFERAGVKGLGFPKTDEFLMPESEIHDDEGVLPMTTLLAAAKWIPHPVSLDQQVELEITNAWIHRFDRHFSVSHPGDETHQKIDRILRDDMVSSFDVEAGPIQRAMLRVREQVPDATFTPIYSFSDDPRTGRNERHKTLAYGGPLHDNSKPDSKLNPLLLALMDLAYACRGQAA